MNCASFKFESIHYISACLFKSTGVGSNEQNAQIECLTFEKPVKKPGRWHWSIKLTEVDIVFEFFPQFGVVLELPVRTRGPVTDVELLWLCSNITQRTDSYCANSAVFEMPHCQTGRWMLSRTLHCHGCPPKLTRLKHLCSFRTEPIGFQNHKRIEMPWVSCPR